MAKLPRYPIFIPSKGRAERCLTARFLDREGVPFRLVVEPQERDAYASVFGEERLLVLPFRDRGTVVPARNWIWNRAIEEGHERHWQMDDNLRTVERRWRAMRLYCDSGPALAAIEDWVDRYTNVAIAGPNYSMFVPDKVKVSPLMLNVHVYSCSLIRCDLPHRFRGTYNEDTDLCLQVLADGWCTVLFNAFCVQKARTQTMKGGNTDELYRGDGRLKMAHELARRWPGVVEVRRRFGRPQHYVAYDWKRFDTPLERRPDVDFDALGETDERGMKFVELERTDDPDVRRWLDQEPVPGGTS